MHHHSKDKVFVLESKESIKEATRQIANIFGCIDELLATIEARGSDGVGRNRNPYIYS